MDSTTETAIQAAGRALGEAIAGPFERLAAALRAALAAAAAR